MGASQGADKVRVDASLIDPHQAVSPDVRTRTF